MSNQTKSDQGLTVIEKSDRKQIHVQMEWFEKALFLVWQVKRGPECRFTTAMPLWLQP